MENQIKDFTERLKDERIELLRLSRFMNEHNFTHEREHIQTKINIITEIVDGLDSVLVGTKKGNSVTFRF